MSVLTGFVVYFLIWWVVLFAVLPWGIQRQEDPEPGHDPGAPVRTHLWAKIGATSLISAVLWAAAFWLIQSPWISFRH